MRLSVASALQILTVFQSLFFAGFLLVPKRRRGKPANALLGALLALLAIHVAAELVQELGGDGVGPRWPTRFAYLVDGTFGLLYGPLLFGFVRSLTFPRPLRRSDFFHLASYAVALAALASGLAGSSTTTALVFVSLGAYLIATTLTLRAYRQLAARARSDGAASAVRWLSFAVGAFAVAYLTDLLMTVVEWSGQAPPSMLSNGVFGALLVWVSGFVLAALCQPQLFSAVSAQEVAAVEAAIQPDDGESDDLLRLERLMATERPFLQPQLTLLEMARMAGMSPRRLSALVNRGRSRTFSDWVNGFRVEEAKRLLAVVDPSAASITDVLFASGFNSKSTFNAVFKDKTGQSPRAYRRQCIGDDVRDYAGA